MLTERYKRSLIMMDGCSLKEATFLEQLLDSSPFQTTFMWLIAKDAGTKVDGCFCPHSKFITPPTMPSLYKALNCIIMVFMQSIVLVDTWILFSKLRILIPLILVLTEFWFTLYILASVLNFRRTIKFMAICVHLHIIIIIHESIFFSAESNILNYMTCHQCAKNVW